MKLLMTADAVGGVWTYALDLSAALAEYGVTVVLATMGPRPTHAQRTAMQLLDNVQLVESDYRLEWMDHCWADVAAAGEWLLDLAHANAVDVVHLNGYSHASLPWRRPVVCVAHSCVLTWWRAVHGTQPPAKWHTYRFNVARGLNSADQVIAPTQAFLEQLRLCHALHSLAGPSSRRPAQVIHNARAEPVTPEGKSSERLPIVLACGRPWDVSKNLGVLDAAACGLPWHTYVMGSALGPDGQSFAPSSLRCLGALPSSDVDAWLHRASIFAHPALYEPFGLAVLEAASAGCALVLADIPTLRELWSGAAEFFDPRNSLELRDALELLIEQPDWRRTLATAARERASTFSIGAMAAEYLQVYQSLVDHPVSGERVVA